MDLALSAVKAVYSVTVLVIEKVDELDKLRRRESRFSRQYKKAILSLSEESKQIQAQMNTLINHGNDFAMNSLLNSQEGREALDNLTESLAKSDGFLKKQERAVNSLIGHLKKYQCGFRQSVALTLTLDDREEKFEEVMEDASRNLDEFRSDLLRYLSQLKDLYEVFLTVTPVTSPSARSGSPMQERAERRKTIATDIQHAFYQRPFHFSLTKAISNDIASDIDITKGQSTQSDSLVAMMKEMGTRWVDDNVKNETVASLSQTQTDLLEYLLRNIDLELRTSQYKYNETVQDPSVTDAIRCAHLADIKLTLDKEIKRVKTQKFSIAFCGMVKAGKSLFLNALTGNGLLPSDDLPSTAWPCRVLHVKGQRIPSLELDPKYFQSCIKALRSKKYGAMMVNYTPPEEHDLYSALFDDEDHRPTLQASQETKGAIAKREIYIRWIDLHEVTKNNLRRFEQPNYSLPERAEGDEDVIDLLGQINDIIRLCGRFELTVPATKPDKWPLLKVEFESLREENVEGSFEFIDLPGVGESNSEFHRFEDLVKGVAKEVNAVVPIVSFKEVAKEDWRQQLPAIIKSGLGRPPDLVVCTHFDQVAKDRVEEQSASVAKAFWAKNEEARQRVLCCASRMGISARMLLNLSQRSKPKFTEIWQEDSIIFDCVEKIIGAYKSKITYDGMSHVQWKRSLEEQLSKSGLQVTTKRLVNDMVVTAHRRLLIDEGSRISRQLHKAISNQHRSLLEMRRTLDDHEKAFEDFQVLSEKYQAILEEWTRDRARHTLKSSDKLGESFKLIDMESGQLLSKVIDKKVDEFSFAHRVEFDGDDKMVFHQANFAELFLQQVQKTISTELASLKKKFVTFVRNLATKSHAEHFKTLKDKIKKNISDDLQLGLKEDILDELNDRGASVESMTFINIRQKVMHTVAIRHTGSTAYRAIEEAIAKPFLKRDPVDSFLEEQDESDDEDGEKEHNHDEGKDGDGQKTVDDLGFMLKAPIAVIASVSWLLGSGIWPFMKQSELFIMSKKEFSEELNRRILRPFLESLKKEGQTTLTTMMEKSWEIAKGIVEDELENEKQRYNCERDLKQDRPSEEAVSSAMATFYNFVAAESAIMRLNSNLRNISID